jgi:uncharacterized membrane protein (DUF373 family)
VEYRASPETEPRDSAVAEALVGWSETAIQAVAAALLSIAAGFTIVGAVVDLIEGADSRSIGDAGVFVLDRVLLLFILAELLYTLRLVNLRGRILVEPFLFIGLIAVVRKILVTTAEAGFGKGRPIDFLIDIGALAALVLVLSASIHLLRTSAARQP